MTLMTMPLLHVLLLSLLPNATAEIFNCRPTPHPNTVAPPPSSNATATLPSYSNVISIHVDCCLLILFKCQGVLYSAL
jgi:hypothetical protein